MYVRVGLALITIQFKVKVKFRLTSPKRGKLLYSNTLDTICGLEAGLEGRRWKCGLGKLSAIIEWKLCVSNFTRSCPELLSLQCYLFNALLLLSATPYVIMPLELFTWQMMISLLEALPIDCRSLHVALCNQSSVRGRTVRHPPRYPENRKSDRLE
jgi:hypothetical protein